MADKIQRITPFLWFDHQAEEAAKFYTSIFKNSRITRTTRFPKATEEVSGKPAGSVMTVAFELDGQEFVALNGGPRFTFSLATSFVVNCQDQAEVDYYWERLTEGGHPEAQQCGWLMDKFGVSWQVVPVELPKLLGGENSEKATEALLGMKKIDIETLKTV